ncbi:helix-turn-helix domain-containing protein [Roseovarius spongiae]|uniref:Helix-turn-helix domain-containing protein n=1 Tax=Roseovarius spongiae TaxID=2320272 RepID=A0A3A8BA46_9RHOB|nr:helix-turn-helix domain-containing protein [Roseovarius spongiae]RKF15313.1 helix-turn-helix domain-containing protein [Roseovarius spongiae]
MASSALPTNLSDNVHHQAGFLPEWDQQYMQMSRGEFSGSVTKLRSGAICLFDEQMNRQVFQVGGLPEGKVGFGLPVRIAGNSYLCGQATELGRLLVFSGSSGFEFLSPRDFRFFGVEIDVTRTDDLMLRRLVETLKATFAACGRSIELNAGAEYLLRQSLFSVFDFGRKAEIENGDRFNRQIVGAVLDCLPDAGDREISVEKHWDTVSRMRDLVHGNPLCPRTVAEVTAELGVSRRTLQNACRDILDASPVQFLRALRLSEVRRAIADAPSVTDVATQYGFWHLGYFSRDYKAMFGESPSCTLRRYQQRAGAAHA